MIAITESAEDYKGFIITCQELPLTSAKWTANVSTNDARLLALLGGRATPIDGRTCEDILSKAKQYIDKLLK
jgi:hypothetical protein